MTLHDASILLHSIPLQYNPCMCVYIYTHIFWRGCLVPSGDIDCKCKMRKGSWRCFTPRLKRYFRWKRKESDDTILYSQRMHQWSKNDEWHSDVHPQSGITIYHLIYLDISQTRKTRHVPDVFLQKSMASMAKWCQVSESSHRPCSGPQSSPSASPGAPSAVPPVPGSPGMLKITIPYING